MLEEYGSNNQRDFSQRYVGTYGFFHTVGVQGSKKILVLLSAIDHGDLSFSDERGGKYSAKPDVGNIFEFLPLTRKLFLHKNNVLYLCRKTARQWQRGVSDSNTQIRNLNTRRDMSISFSILNSAYATSNETTREEVQQFIDKDTDTLLLSPAFAIVAGVVYLYNVVIGTYLDGKIELESALFHQEILDVLRKLSFSLEVTVK